MAGCAVTVPLNTQHGTELFRGEHLRIVISESVDGITIEQASQQKKSREFHTYREISPLLLINCKTKKVCNHNSENLLKTIFQYHAHKIRAPEGI